MSEPVLVEAVARCLAVLEALSETPEGAGVSELARLARLPKATTHRICRTLTQDGFLRQDAVSRAYQPGWRLIGLIHRIGRAIDLRTAAAPVLSDLSRKTDGYAFVSQLSDEADRLVVIADVRQDSAIRIASCLGQTSGLDGPLGGRACLAAMRPEERDRLLESPDRRTDEGANGDLARQLEQIRRHGYDIATNVNASGIDSITSAVTDLGGQPIGAVGVLLPTTKVQSFGPAALGALCVEASQQIRQTLGGCEH